MSRTTLITAAEAARRLGVSRERVRQLLTEGMLAGVRIEGHARPRYVDLSGEGARATGSWSRLRRQRDVPG